MFDVDIRYVGKYMSIDDELYDIREIKELLIKIKDIEYDLESENSK